MPNCETLELIILDYIDGNGAACAEGIRKLCADGVAKLLTTENDYLGDALDCFHAFIAATVA